MKIAFLCDWYLPRQGGIELHLRDLAAALAGRGHDVHVVTPTRASTEEQGWRLPAATAPDPDGVRVHRLDVPLLPVYKLAFTPGAVRATADVLRREAFDVVHAHIGVVAPMGLVGTWLAQGTGVPTAATFHSVLGPMGPLLRVADAVTGWSRWPVAWSAVGSGVAAEVEAAGGVRADVVPNAVDVEAWRAARPPREAGVLRAVAVMRLNPRKRGEALLWAVDRARAELGDAVSLRLTVVGDGTQRGRLERKVARLGLEGTVRLVGHRSREEVRDALARADVFLLPSRMESFGISALEARAAGVPVLAHRTAGVGAFVEAGRHGYLVDDDGEMARRLVELARHPERLAALARASRDDPPSGHGWAAAVERTEALYRRASALRGSEMEGGDEGRVREGDPPRRQAPTTIQPGTAAADR